MLILEMYLKPFRTLRYLTRHLWRVSQHGARTGMTARNIAIVWAPNLLRCARLEGGGVAALQGVGVQVFRFIYIYIFYIYIYYGSLVD